MPLPEEKRSICPVLSLEAYLLWQSRYGDYSNKIYKAKDVVEKCFSRLKNTLDLNRLRVHNDERMENKLFISFIALLLISELHQRMLRGGLYKTYTMHELLLKVRKLRVARLNGKRIVQPISKEQHEIFKALGFEDPVV